MADPVVVLDGVRTAIGKQRGALKSVEACDLGAICIRALLERTALESTDVDEVVMGQVGQVGPDAFNARRCALQADLPASVPAMNVNRLCASGLQAIVTSSRSLLAGDGRVVVAGGDESMTRQPTLRYTQAWDGHSPIEVDGTMALLTDPFGGYPMGITAERVAARHRVSRKAQDDFAFESQRRAAEALRAGSFDPDIVPVPLEDGRGWFRTDEHPRPGTTQQDLARLEPVFEPGGTVTAGNAAGINDGAAATVLMRESEARRRGLRGRLRLVSYATVGIAPDVMGYAPALAIPKALSKAGLRISDIDVFELNEAFAAQAVAVIRALGLDEDRVNPWGGAIAFGHPIGATGAILTVKLARELEQRDGRFGVVSLCVGGGQGVAAVFDRP